MNTTLAMHLAALTHQAFLRLRADDLSGAEALYRQILDLDAEHREALFNVVQCLLLQEKPIEAAKFERRFLALGPAQSDILKRMGSFLYSRGKGEEALVHYKKALEIHDTSLELYRGIAEVFSYLGRPADAIEIFERATKSAPRNAVLLALLAEVYRSLNRFDDALANARKAVAIKPDFIYSHRTIAWILLQQGDYAQGLQLQEKRFNFDNREELQQIGITAGVEKVLKKPFWKGEPLEGKTILVWTEQGIGDSIMMMRYLPLLKQKGAGSVIVYCHHRLVKLMLTMTSLVVNTEFEISNETFDLQCSMFSLPYLFGTTLESIPATVPYLKLSHTPFNNWAEQLKKFAGLKVGIAWAGNSKMPKDSLRSIALENFAPLIALQGVQLISLQKVDGVQQLKAADWPILDWMDACEDVVDTATLIENLDLVISVDTAVAHLAGALGKPVWLLNRFESEWRWLIDREDSPWYPTMRIFRQPAMHDWSSVINRVTSELGKLSAGHAGKITNNEEWKKAARAADRVLGIAQGDATTRPSWKKLATFWRS